jgi:hypothetical protein
MADPNIPSDNQEAVAPDPDELVRVCLSDEGAEMLREYETVRLTRLRRKMGEVPIEIEGGIVSAVSPDGAAVMRRWVYDAVFGVLQDISPAELATKPTPISFPQPLEPFDARTTVYDEPPFI